MRPQGRAEDAATDFADVDLVLVMGTSLQVAPFCALPNLAEKAATRVLVPCLRWPWLPFFPWMDIDKRPCFALGWRMDLLPGKVNQNLEDCRFNAWSNRREPMALDLGGRVGRSAKFQLSCHFSLSLF